MKLPASAAFRQFRSTLLFPAVVAIAFASFSPARAADISWNVTGPAPWTTGSNWSGGVAPGAADRALILNGGAATIASGETIGINTFRFVNGTLTMTGGSLSATSTTDYPRIGDYTFNATVGTVNLNMSGSSSISAAGRLYIADGESATTAAATTANIALADSASIKNGNDYLIIGRNHGRAVVDLYGTSSIAKMGTTNPMILGDGDLSNSSVTLHDPGTAISSTGEIWVGNGTNAVSNLKISAGSVTKANSGGSFITVARSNATGTLAVEGDGQLISNISIRLAEGASANALLTAKDNAIVQAANAMNIGYQGTGKLDVSGNAQVTVGGEVSVGTGSGKGTLLMTGGVFNANGAGTYVVGGSVNAQATVALSGSSVFNGGAMKWKSGDFGGTANAGTVAFNLSGNSSLTLREFTIGHIGGATATENVNLGDNAKLTVNNFITIGRDDANTNGSMVVHVNLNGGTLATQSIRAGGGASSATNNNVIANGGKIQALAAQPDFFQPTSNNANRTYVQLNAGGLTFDTNGFAVGIQNPLNGSGGLVKTGAGTLKLSGSQPFTGLTTVNQGALEVDSSTAMAGGIALAGGNLIKSGSSNTPFSAPSLTFANGSMLSLQSLDVFTTPIKTTGSLSASGIVKIGISGGLEVGDYPLIDHTASGAIGGDGIGAFQLAPLGRGVVANIADVSGVVVLQVTEINPLVWKGNASSDWDIDSTENWTLSGAPSKYHENDNVLFNDSASTGSVTLNTAVNPSNVAFENSTKDYTISGTGGIGGSAALTKNGSGMLTLATMNSLTGITTVNDGTLRFGDGVADGSVGGPLVVNYANVIFNTASASTISGDISGSGDEETFIVKTGPGTQTITSPTNMYAGAVHIDQGTLRFGNGAANGAIGAAASYTVASGATLAVESATAVNFGGFGSNVTGSGVVSLNSAQPVNGSANWGPLAFPATFTGVLEVKKGRVESSSSTNLGGISKIKLADGSQYLAFSSAAPYTAPLDIAGLGWGEGGYNQGALRAAAGTTATWAGNVNLTADSGIMVQVSSNFTVTGSITGPFVSQFYVQDGSTLTLAPAAAVQNSYGATRINGTANGAVVAGNPFAFSTGPLEVNSSTLKLNGNSFTFASLAGTGGTIGNYHASAPSVLTVGNAASTTYAGVIADGGAGKLSLVKNGAGTLTLTGANTYSGSTTVHGGVLSLNTAFLSDTAGVTIDSGAVLNLVTGASDTVGSLVLGGVTVPGGTYGPTHPTYGAYFTGTGSLTVVGTAGYSAWAAAAGLEETNSGLGQDPESDGIANLLEFYLDGNPLASSASILPATAIDANYLTLTFHRRDDAEADVTNQSVEYGSSLTGVWNAVAIGAADSGPNANGVIVTVAENAAAPDSVTVKIPRSLAQDGKLFARLKVSK